MSEEELIHGCLKFERSAQRALFEIYSSAMMDVCVRYAKNQQEAKEILLAGYKNIFNRLKGYAEETEKTKKDSSPMPLGDWIKKEIILSAIQHMHNNKREYFVSSTVNARDAEKSSSEETSDEKIMQATNRQTIIKALQQLSPSYRAIYNLHEVEEYPHAEISKLLDISEYTSKDSLSKAKFNLRKNLARMVPK